MKGRLIKRPAANSGAIGTECVIRSPRAGLAPRRLRCCWKKAAAAALAFVLILSLGACGNGGRKIRLDPKNPVTVSIWHYYNGAILNAFETMIKDFNETVGVEEGIIVEAFGMGDIAGLEKAVIASANKEIGSSEMPDIFASYADTAYEAEKMNLLANLDDYLTKEEQAEYLESYIEEGRIGLNGELRIFPIAKSTEVLMVNETDWLPFAEAGGFTYDDWSTMEGIVRLAGAYYQWTDSQTPDTPNDGKALFARDGIANLFIITSKQFGTEIFNVSKGAADVDINEDVMRKIWDNYYVPYISGYFYSYGRYRSDDAKVGDILAYVGSTASASYFPTEVSVSGRVYPVTAKILPAPLFEGGAKVAVQQGAGMVVTKGTQQNEYASVVFLKWLTDTQKNIEFSALSGYMPVKKEAMDYETLKSTLDRIGLTVDAITDKTLQVALEEIKDCELYTNKAFDGGSKARSVLEYNLQDKATADREKVLTMIEKGISRDEAVATFNTEEFFQSWMAEITQALNDAANK